MDAAHVELPNSRRPMKAGAQRLRDVDPNAHVRLTVALKGPALPDPDMAKPSLTAEEYAKQFAIDPKTVAKVENVLRSYGLAIDSVTPDGRSIQVSGTMAQVQEAFPANVGVYHDVEQGEYRGREGTIGIPAQLNGLIEDVFGLDQRRVARRHQVASRISAVGAPVTPQDLEKRYNFPAGDGGGQTIAIAEFGSPTTSGSILPPAYFPDDVDAFNKKYGLASPNVTIVPVDIAPLTAQQVSTLPAPLRRQVLEVTTEVMMDVEIVASLCPRASILVFFTTFDEKGWVDLLDAVVSGAHGTLATLSISWGSAEDSPDWSAGALQTINQRFQAAALQGITACVSSGDDGSGDEMNDSRGHVDFPASSPYVLAVGGTMLVDNAGTPDEVAWWQSPGYRTGNGGGSTGGGVSVVFDRPAWQNVHIPSINPRSIDGRVVPDVSALAGPPFYDLIYLNSDQPNGGTSASAPLLAALIARTYANKPATARGFLTPWLYTNDVKGKPNGASACRDITVGKNTSSPNPGRGYTAGPGYDAVSGWGVPNGQAL